MKRLALRGALTAKFGDEAIKVIDTFGLDAIKTPRPRRGPRRRSRPAAGSSSSPRVATSSSSCRPATCRPSRSSSPTRSTSSTCSRPTSSSSSSRPSPGWRRCTRERPDRRRDHPPPGRSARSRSTSREPRQVHVRRPRRRQQDPDQGRRSRSSTEGKVTVVERQRPDDEGQGEETRHQPRPDQRLHLRRGARRS